MASRRSRPRRLLHSDRPRGDPRRRDHGARDRPKLVRARSPHPLRRLSRARSRPPPPASARRRAPRVADVVDRARLAARRALPPERLAADLSTTPGPAPAARRIRAASPQRRRPSTGGSGQRPPAPSRTSYRGRNHVWIPSLGINRSVQSFPCSRSRPPDAGVYRWGCAGRNNVYLMGHAWSTFKPLHDAYVRGRLHKGMKVVYADGGGSRPYLQRDLVAVVTPTTAASWAWAARAGRA